MGGCVITITIDIAYLASFTAKLAFHVSGQQLVHFTATFCKEPTEPLLRMLGESVSLLPPQCLLPRVWLAEKRLPAKAEPDWLKLEYWCDKMQQFRLEKLLSRCSGRDLVRLQCQRSPSIGAWLSAIPSRALGMEISPPIYRILLCWWLGLPLVASTDNDDTLDCPFCGDAMDCYGDHILCCNKAEFYSRHQAVVKCATAFLAAAGLRVANEVQIEGRERPADIFVDWWTTADPVAIDVTVTHPLAPSLGLNVRAAKAAAAAREKQKLAKYAHLIQDKHLNFIPAAFTTFGALGPEATRFVDDAADFYSAKRTVDRGVCRMQLVQRVQVALLHEVGKRLLGGIQAEEEEDF